MRLDVRENLRRAARAEHEHSGNSVILIADELVDDLSAEWSDPLQVRMFRPEADFGVVEVTFRYLEETA